MTRTEFLCDLCGSDAAGRHHAQGLAVNVDLGEGLAGTRISVAFDDQDGKILLCKRCVVQELAKDAYKAPRNWVS